MGTTPDPATVARATIADMINQALLNTRDTLPKERNGRPMAPSDARAAQIRKDIGQGRATPVQQLLTVTECDIADGVPLDRALAPILQLVAHLEREERHHMDRPLMTLVRAETRMHCRTSLAELRAVDSPASLDALSDVVREVAAERAVLTQIEEACIRQIAVVRAAPRPAHDVGRAQRLAVLS
jgi:hypothetical protein